MNTFFDECNTDIRKLEQIVPSLHEDVRSEWTRFSESPFYPHQISSFLKVQTNRLNTDSEEAARESLKLRKAG